MRLKTKYLVLLTDALAAVENKISDHGKYITTPEINKLTAQNFTRRLKQGNLSIRTDFVNFLKNTDFNDKLNKNKIKACNG